MKFAVAATLLALLAVACHGHIDDSEREALVADNRAPKTRATNGVCEECESIMQRIVAVARDPTKLAELKILLSALCGESGYPEECRAFVSKIDFFIRELSPYLKDAHKVCTDLHMCSNKNIELFHRVGLLYAKKYLNKIDGAQDLICEECQFAATELTENVIDKPAIQADARRFLTDNVCKHLGSFLDGCDILVDDFLPDLFKELHALLQRPREFCEHVRLCKATALSQRQVHKVSSRVIKKIME